ncbi:hypothetical protein Hanom_Chr07g00602691 [Helianthus anomalus]
MVVSSQNRYTGTRLPIPYPNSLIITSTNNPGVLMVKLNRPNIIKVAKQREQTPVQLVIPYFNFVIISCMYNYIGNEKYY